MALMFVDSLDDHSSTTLSGIHQKKFHSVHELAFATFQSIICDYHTYRWKQSWHEL